MTNQPDAVHPCICGCGRLTKRLYYPGCDSILKSALIEEMVLGTDDATETFITLHKKTVSDDEKRRAYAEYRAKRQAH